MAQGDRIASQEGSLDFSFEGHGLSQAFEEQIAAFAQGFMDASGDPAKDGDLVDLFSESPSLISLISCEFS